VRGLTITYYSQDTARAAPECFVISAFWSVSPLGKNSTAPSNKENHHKACGVRLLAATIVKTIRSANAGT